VANPTTTPALTLGLASGQTANRFLATPNGASGAVGLRAIQNADLPTSLSVGGSLAVAGVTTFGTATNTSIDGTGVLTVGGVTIDDVGNLTASAGILIDLTGSGSVTVPTPTLAQNAATKGYVDNAVVGLFDYKGGLNASTNPNYPAASKGDVYKITVAGRVGGASGKQVDAGDMLAASADNAGGTEASVGASWDAFEHNLIGALLAANSLSDVASPSAARGNIGAAPLDSPAFTGVARVDAKYGAITADVDGATITFNLDTSDKHSVTLAGNRTLALSGGHDGQGFVLILKQDGTGGRTVTWFSNITWMTSDGNPPVLATGAGKRTVVSFLRVGATDYLGLGYLAQP
jgi:hypothetical protein